MQKWLCYMLYSKSRLLHVFFAFLFGTFCITGLVSYQQLTSFYYKYNLINVNLSLELLFFLFALFTARSINFKSGDFLVVLTLLFYLILSFFSSIAFNGDEIVDFLMIFKAFVYLILLLIFKRNKLLSIDTLYLIFVFLCGAILLKYFFGIFIVGIPRPGLLYENNSELLIIYILFFYLNKFHFKVKQNNIKFIFLIVLITLLSGSRSAALCAVVTLFLLNGFSFKTFFWGLLATISLTIVQLQTRGFDLQEIDRFRFLIDFYQLYSQFSKLELLIGSPAITSLPEEVCLRYSFYESLVSSDSRICYSVVFHSYILRALFDHGIFWSLLLMYGYFRLVKNEIGPEFAIFVTIIALVNGLSVSSYNSIYLNFTLLLLIMCNKKFLKEGFPLNSG